MGGGVATCSVKMTSRLVSREYSVVCNEAKRIWRILRRNKDTRAEFTFFKKALHRVETYLNRVSLPEAK